MQQIKVEQSASYRLSLKVCGECDGIGGHMTGRYRNNRTMCKPCLGSGQYTYDSDGNRIAWHGHKREWVLT